MSTDIAEVRDNVADSVKSGAASALDTVKAQAAAAAPVITAAARSAFDTAQTQGKKAGRKARKRAQELAEEAQKAAAKASKDARKRADKASKKASKKGKQKAHELSIAVQEKAGRHPRRKKRVVVFGGIALAGVAVATVLKRKSAGSTDDYAPVTPPSSEAQGNSTGK